MRILLSTGSLSYLPIEDVFDIAGQAGFDGCELVIGDHFDDAGYMERVEEAVRILPVHSIHAPYIKLRGWGESPEALFHTLEAAKKLGAKVVTFHPPSWFSMELGFLKWFRKVKDFQKELSCEGVFLALENMPLVGGHLMLAPYFLNSYEDLIVFGIERNLYFTYDTTHMGAFKKDVVAPFLEYFRTGRLKNIHLSDYKGIKEHLFLGRGELPVVRFLGTLRRLGYDGCVTLELAPQELPKARDWLIKALTFQSSFMRLHLGLKDNG